MIIIKSCWTRTRVSRPPTDDTDEQRNQLMTTLERLKDLYKWGDKTRRGYMAESNELEQALRLLPRTDHDEAVTRLADFLQDVVSVWGGGDPEASEQAGESFARVRVGEGAGAFCVTHKKLSSNPS